MSGFLAQVQLLVHHGAEEGDFGREAEPAQGGDGGGEGVSEEVQQPQIQVDEIFDAGMANFDSNE